MWRVRVAAVAAIVTVAGLLAVPAPAWADAANAGGYVWVSDGTVTDYTPVDGYWFSSARAPVSVHRAGVGRYQVSFAGLGGAGGVAHVDGYGWSSPRFCTVPAWKPSGTTEVVWVYCFGPGGVPTDTAFTVNYVRRAAVPADHFSALYANNPSATGPYTPAGQFDTDGAPATVERIAAGRYRILDDTYAAAAGDPNGPQFAVTAVSSLARHCWLWDEADEGLPLGYQVQCADAGGRPVDTAFTYTYVVGGNLFGDRPAAGWAGGWARPDARWSLRPAEVWDSSAGLTPTFEWLGTGLYRVVLPGLARWGGQAQAFSVGFWFVFCTVTTWGPVGPDQVLIVECWDIVSSAPADANVLSVVYTG